MNVLKIFKNEIEFCEFYQILISQNSYSVRKLLLFVFIITENYTTHTQQIEDGNFSQI